MNTSTVYVHTKHFTLEEASASLILVTPILRDLMAKYKQILSLRRELSVLEHDDSDVRYSRLETLTDGARHNLYELEQIGCVLKDAELGLVDFPALYENREIYLCWQYGESEILYYHSLSDGFDKRKPINFELIS